jgi:hypothetical protein
LEEQLRTDLDNSSKAPSSDSPKSRAERRKKPRSSRARGAQPGMMIHQDGSTHEWVPGQQWDLIVTMDDTTREHYSMFFVEEEGTASSFRGVQEVNASIEPPNSAKQPEEYC